MEKVLPLADTPTETYQGGAFILSILLAHENTKNIYYNNYINLECDKVDDIFEVKLNFAGTSWEDYRLCGAADMNMYYLKNIHMDYFSEFIKERIDQGNYILFYNIDEYYLSYSKHFLYDHLLHDTYVYGYAQEEFFVMAYRNKKLARFGVPIREIQSGLYYHENADKNLSFCTFRPNSVIFESIDPLQVKRSLCNYLYSHYQIDKNERKTYGISIYDVLLKSLKAMLMNAAKKASDIDLRPFRLLWEHKRILKEHIIKMHEMLVFTPDIDIMAAQLESDAEIIFRTAMKYSALRNGDSLKKLSFHLSQMRDNEEKIIHLLLDDFDQNGVR